MNARTIASLCLFLLVACTSGSDDPVDAGDSPNGRATQGSGGSDVGGSPSDGSDGSGGSTEAPETAGVTLDERKRDATSSGDVAGYPELSRVRLEGSNEGVTIDMRFARAVPEQTPKGVQMTIAFSIIDSEGGRYLLNALGNEKGWSSYVVTSEGQQDFGGLFEISGRTVTLGIPWTDLGGPTPFNWIASSAWAGAPEDGASYAFDSIPDEGFAGFPAPPQGEGSP